MPLYEGDGTVLGVNGFQTVYEGDGTVLWSDELSAGTRIYTASQFSSLRRYNVTQAYTARDLDNTETISSEGTEVLSLTWKPDGTRFYETAQDVDQPTIFQYEASEPFSIENATLSKSILSNNTYTEAIEWSPGGDRLFQLSSNTSEITQSTTDEPWDIGGEAVEESNSFDGNNLTGMTFRDDGYSLYLLDNDTASIREHFLDTPFDISVSSASSTPAITYSSDIMEEGYGLAWSSDGKRLWYADRANGFGTLNINDTPFDLGDVVGESGLRTNEVHTPRSIYFNGQHPHEDAYDGDTEI